MDKILGIGPFYGDFKSEILFFRPFVDWIKENVDCEMMFIGTHFNRQFLYNPEKSIFFSVFEHLTRHEFLQKDIIHKEILQKDFQLLKKKFQKNIATYCHIKKNDPILLSLNYQSSNKIDLPQRIFTQIDFTPFDLEEEDFIVLNNNIEEAMEILKRSKSSIGMRRWRLLKGNN